MARTIDEIKTDLQYQYFHSELAVTLYGLTRDGDLIYDGGTAVDFDTYFSKVAVERLLIYIIAYCANFLERLLDDARAELTALVEQQAPGRCEWYARKLKEFQYGDETNEAGEYDTVDESKRIVKHAVAIDDTTTSRQLVLKVAGDDGQGGRAPLDDAQQAALKAYITRIKYAGVPVMLINAPGDIFNCRAKIYYNPELSADTVEESCKEAIKAFVENLPFNGEYSDMALEDALQGTPGVKVVVGLSSESRKADEAADATTPITDKVRPYAGYYQTGEITLELTAYE